MEPEKGATVQFIADQGLCNGCGTCHAVCPSGSISIIESPTGLLLADVDSGSCVLCGDCTSVCPATSVSPGMISDADPFSGRPLSGFSGFATNSLLRENGQSGGVATALISCLLESREADKALLTGTGNDPLRPGPVLIESFAGMAGSTQSSRYCPVALNSALDEIDELGRLVYVGLSCHVRGLHNYLHQFGKGRGQPIIIGLFCDSVLSYRAIDYIIAGANLLPREVAGFRFKDKRCGPFPGNGTVKSVDGKKLQVPNSRRVFAKGILKPPFCYLCHDKLNIHADVSLGDSWGLGKSRQGWSAGVCFTEKGEIIVEKATAAKHITVEPVSVASIVSGQDIASRRSCWETSVSLWKGKGKFIPAYGPRVLSEGFPNRLNIKAGKRFKRALDLFSSRTRAEFESKFRRLTYTGYVPFRVKHFISETTVKLFNRE